MDGKESTDCSNGWFSRPYPEECTALENLYQEGAFSRETAFKDGMHGLGSEADGREETLDDGLSMTACDAVCCYEWLTPKGKKFVEDMRTHMKQ